MKIFTVNDDYVNIDSVLMLIRLGSQPMTLPPTKSLMTRIREAAASLKKAGAREVFLFGSAARGTLREGSDIDLAVTGLPPRYFFKAMGEAGDILKLPLDLVDLDEDTPFTRYLREEGELVHIV